jgi:sRNA-binding carbon storage regulator CsrA
MSNTTCRQIGRVSDAKWQLMKDAADRAGQSFTQWATDALLAAVAKQAGESIEPGIEVKRNGMLVLTRRSGERLVLRVRQDNGKMVSGLLGVKICGKDRIRVEFEAPAAFELWREEIANKGQDNGT